MAIYLGRRLPTASSDQPEDDVIEVEDFACVGRNRVEAKWVSDGPGYKETNADDRRD